MPRVLEARGLDVTPAIREKVKQRGDLPTCDVLDIIYRDEVGHVQIGTRWYAHLCEQRGLEPMGLFRNLLRRFDMFIFRGYVNLEARERAGFSQFEMAMLEDFENRGTKRMERQPENVEFKQYSSQISHLGRTHRNAVCLSWQNQEFLPTIIAAA